VHPTLVPPANRRDDPVTKPLITRPCIDCGRYRVSRKQVHLHAETVCARCTTSLTRGLRWHVLNCLVCDHCAEACNRCRPSDRRLQWGEGQHTPFYIRKLAKGGKLLPPKPPAEVGLSESAKRSERRRAQREAQVRRILDAKEEHPTWNTRTIAKRLDLSDATVERALGRSRECACGCEKTFIPTRKGHKYAAPLTHEWAPPMACTGADNFARKTPCKWSTFRDSSFTPSSS
jgi:hypothetical protein